MTFVDKKSADKAMEVLHGAELAGIKLKVLPAEPMDDSRKRPRTT